jgi:hypothetical protein
LERGFIRRQSLQARAMREVDLARDLGNKPGMLDDKNVLSIIDQFGG